ncbi:DUF3159 domain-containing protein [Leucobacter zeae]|nr:DUF3159 domain-containing protein [Leucobacter zeae]
MSGSAADDAPGPDRDPEPARGSESTADPGAAERIGSRIGGGLADAMRSGASGEQLTADGLLAAIGGWRGIGESLVPALLFLAIYIPTQDARLSALVPGGLAVALVVIRLVRRETLVSAISGMLGVGVAVLITLITGRGIDYYLSGFVINAAWALGLFISVIVGWPALGLAIGAFSGDLTGWRRKPAVRRVATLLTLLWLSLFVLRLAVQLPLYLSEQVAALGFARIAMGVPLFAAVIVVTWFTARKHLRSSDDSAGGSVAETGQNTPPA